MQRFWRNCYESRILQFSSHNSGLLPLAWGRFYIIHDNIHKRSFSHVNMTGISRVTHIFRGVENNHPGPLHHRHPYKGESTGCTVVWGGRGPRTPYCLIGSWGQGFMVMNSPTEWCVSSEHCLQRVFVRTIYEMEPRVFGKLRGAVKEEKSSSQTTFTGPHKLDESSKEVPSP